MRTVVGAGLSALFFLVGCGSDAANDTSKTESGCTTAPSCGSCTTCYETCVCGGKSTSSCASQCGSASGGSGGGGGASGAGGGAGGPVKTTEVTIETDSRSVAPGEETFFCQNFANPFGGAVDVLQSESFMTPGSHHMFVFYEKAAQDGPLEDCSGLEYQRTLHVAQTPQQLTRYPAGVGRFVSAASGLRVLAHYVNTGDKPISAKITVVFQVAPAGTVAQWAGALFFNNLDVSVPPLQAGKATKTCTIPYDIKLMDVVSHMHQWGVDFEAKTDKGVSIYQGTSWEEPEVKAYDPPLELPSGTQITYTCNYQNSSSKTLTFGDSALVNEMCILSGTFFPTPNGQSIVCM